jgi:hypothetical protein
MRQRTLMKAAIASIPVILLILLLGVLHKGISGELAHWQVMSEGAPANLIRQIQQDNLKGNTNVRAMKFWQISQPGQSKLLYLIDSRTAHQDSRQPLCGELGCAFFGYVEIQKNRYERVLSAYLNPRLPPNVALFEPLQRLQNGLPILKVHQLEQQQIRRYRYEFNGKDYEIVETQLLPQRYE